MHKHIMSIKTPRIYTLMYSVLSVSMLLFSTAIMWMRFSTRRNYQTLEHRMKEKLYPLLPELKERLASFCNSNPPGSYNGSTLAGALPSEIYGMNPAGISLDVTSRREAKFVLSFGGGFAHWGIYVGQATNQPYFEKTTRYTKWTNGVWFFDGP